MGILYIGACSKTKNMTKKRKKQLRKKYSVGTLTAKERDEWWPYRLKEMRDEYYKKRGK
jgi:hypothetical protein